MKSKGHYQTTCLMILTPRLKRLAEYLLTGETGISICRCLPAGALGQPRPATPLSLESNPTVSFNLWISIGLKPSQFSGRFKSLLKVVTIDLKASVLASVVIGAASAISIL